jgi:hypothetical protein
VSELTLLVLRLAFLLALWGFVFIVVYALRTDLFGQRVRRQATDAPAAASPFPAPSGQTGPPRAGVAPSASALTEPMPRMTAPAPPAPVRPSSMTASRLVITSGAKSGVELALRDEPLTIGRSAESGLVIRDDYTSTHHARLSPQGDHWVLHDLDSTNGTFLAGVRVDRPTRVPLDTTVKIGTTTFELRR